jgi:hypothetical protein
VKPRRPSLWRFALAGHAHLWMLTGLA